VGNTNRRFRLQIAWRSLRWRAGASIAMLIVATVGLAASAFGPIYLQGAGQSVLQATLRGAPVGAAGLSLLANNDSVTAEQVVHAAEHAPRTPSGAAQYGHVIVTIDRLVSTASLVDGQRYHAGLISRTGICPHLSFMVGSCPRRAGAVALSARSAQALGLHVGNKVSLSIRHERSPVVLAISGIFQTPNFEASYWWGFNYFAYGSGTPASPTLDDFITSQQTALSVAAPGRDPILGQIPLRAARLRSGETTQLEHALARYDALTSAVFRIHTSTSVGQLIDVAADDQHTTTTIVVVVLAQLILLSLIVLYFVAARTAEEREPDLRLAELRGFSFRSRVSVALFEPLVVLAAAVPLGVLVAWLAGRIAAPHLFDGGAAPSVDLLAAGVMLLTFAGGVAAILLGALGLIQRSRHGTLQSGGTAGSRSIGLAIDAVVVAFAVAAFVEVAISGVSAEKRTDPLAVLAPGLLALGLGVAGARLLPLLSQIAVPMTRYSSRVGTSLALRRVARLPNLSRHIVVLSLAVGLATFAVTGWAVAGHNRMVRSEFEVGAPSVLTVQTRPGVEFLQAVREADPTGRYAMAVVTENASDGETLAVDSPRLAAVASWPPRLTHRSAASVARAIAGTTSPPVVLRGRAVRLSVNLLRQIVPAPQLQMTVFDNTFETLSTLNVGALHKGLHNYQVSTAGSCASSCRLVSIGITWSPPSNSAAQSVQVPIRVEALASELSAGEWRPVDASLRQPRQWKTTESGVSLSGTPMGLSVSAHVQIYAPSTFGPTDVPTDLPAVVIGSGSGSGSGTTYGVGLDGNTISEKPVATVNALPGAKSDASMVDLTLAQRFQSGPMIGTTLEVWLAAGTPPSIERKLESEGVTPVSLQTAAHEDGTLSRSGISLAYVFFLLAAVSAALLAIGSTTFALIAAARRRVNELAALRAVGISKASLRRSLVVEQGMVVGFGIVLGIIAGLLATALALSSIPEFVSSLPGPPLDYQIPLGPLGIGLLAILMLLACTVGLTVLVVTNRASINKVEGEA
jgi:putative ABC transport system permease protein